MVKMIAGFVAETDEGLSFKSIKGIKRFLQNLGQEGSKYVNVHRFVDVLTKRSKTLVNAETRSLIILSVKSIHLSALQSVVEQPFPGSIVGGVVEGSSGLLGCDFKSKFRSLKVVEFPIYLQRIWWNFCWLGWSFELADSEGSSGLSWGLLSDTNLKLLWCC
ncbi:hypothetical protein L2E82_51863 [Cichorium intybus]|nr:hypothetical protein L2E82_51863 [Cichorium intybus]